MTPKDVLKAIVPATAQQLVRDARYALSVFKSAAGVYPRECPICDYRGLFRAYGEPPRYDALCPKCGSLERHRLLRLALNKYPLRADAEIIHFAPEAAVAAMLPAKSYRSADLAPGRADLVLDLEAVALPSQGVDVVVVNHVLEHVIDDQRALAESFRILREGGVLIATIPVVEGWDETYEVPDIVGPKDRELHFGQWDHVRYYGPDFRDRVRSAGFSLQEFVGSGDDCVRYGLLAGERVFIGRR
jgi:SAM-dependent methyltransferase